MSPTYRTLLTSHKEPHSVLQNHSKNPTGLSKACPGRKKMNTMLSKMSKDWERASLTRVSPSDPNQDGRNELVHASDCLSEYPVLTNI